MRPPSRLKKMEARWLGSKVLSTSSTAQDEAENISVEAA